MKNANLIGEPARFSAVEACKYLSAWNDQISKRRIPDAPYHHRRRWIWSMSIISSQNSCLRTRDRWSCSKFGKETNLWFAVINLGGNAWLLSCRNDDRSNAHRHLVSMSKNLICWLPRGNRDQVLPSIACTTSDNQRLKRVTPIKNCVVIPLERPWL